MQVLSLPTRLLRDVEACGQFYLSSLGQETTMFI